MLLCFNNKVEFFSPLFMTIKEHESPVGLTVEGVIGIAGGKAAVARACGVSIQSVTKWSGRIPARHAMTVAILAGLPLGIVRPDMVQPERN